MEHPPAEEPFVLQRVVLSEVQNAGCGKKLDLIARWPVYRQPIPPTTRLRISLDLPMDCGVQFNCTPQS